LDFTFVCPTEIVAFSDRIKEFEALNCAVVGCSIDSKYSHLAWVNTPRKEGGLGELKYPLRMYSFLFLFFYYHYYFILFYFHSYSLIYILLVLLILFSTYFFDPNKKNKKKL